MSLNYDNPSLRPSRDSTAEWRTCAVCGDEFPIAVGELTFAREAGIELPTVCRCHRLSRREALAARRQAGGGIRPADLPGDATSDTAQGPRSRPVQIQAEDHADG